MSTSSPSTVAKKPAKKSKQSKNQIDARYKKGVGRWFVLAGAILVGVLVLSPFFIMLLNAFKSPSEYSQNGPLSIPTELYLDGAKNFWTRTDFTRKLWNSIVISTVVAFMGTLISFFSAYAIGIGRVKGRLWLIGLFLMATMLPQEALIYPLFTMANKVGLSASIWSVIIIFTVIQAAFGTYLLSSVLGTFPPALIEAAQLDGAGRWRTMWQVVFPIARPSMSVLVIFFFIWTWNEFFIPLVMLTRSASQTVPIALASLQGDRMMDAPTTNAGALISLVPALIFFLIFQRTLTRGVTAGAVK